MCSVEDIHQYSKRYVIRVLSEISSLKPFFIVLRNVHRYLHYLFYNHYFLPILQLNLRQDFWNLRHEITETS